MESEDPRLSARWLVRTMQVIWRIEVVLITQTIYWAQNSHLGWVQTGIAGLISRPFPDCASQPRSWTFLNMSYFCKKYSCKKIKFLFFWCLNTIFVSHFKFIKVYASIPLLNLFSNNIFIKNWNKWRKQKRLLLLFRGNDLLLFQMKMKPIIFCFSDLSKENYSRQY